MSISTKTIKCLITTFDFNSTFLWIWDNTIREKGSTCQITTAGKTAWIFFSQLLEQIRSVAIRPIALFLLSRQLSEQPVNPIRLVTKMKSVVIDCLKTFKQSRFDKLTFFATSLCFWEQCIRRVVPIRILVFCWTYYTSLHLIKYLTYLLTNVLFEFLLNQSFFAATFF